MSLELLALCHRAARQRGATGDLAREIVCFDDMEGLSFGDTFAQTLDLNSPNLDLYESRPEFRRIALEVS